MTTNDVHQLAQGLQELGLTASTESLLQYLALLSKWNQAYNLTAIRDMDSMISRHLLDSLAITSWLHGERLLDIGTGAGLPGIPLAIVHPHLHVTLLDSNGKKTRFLQEVKRVLALKNIEVVQSRVENYHPEQEFDTVISRAFSDLDQMTRWSHHLLKEKGVWLAMKGHYPTVELTALSWPCHVESYRVPGLESERCCVNIIKDSSWQK